MLYLQSNASGSVPQKCISFVKSRLEFSLFEGSIVPSNSFRCHEIELSRIFFLEIFCHKESIENTGYPIEVPN